MKKLVVVVLIFLQVTWSVKVEGFVVPQQEVVYPSFITLVKIVYISVKTNIRNLINLVYIFSSLPQKQKSKETQQRRTFSIILFFVSENKENKKKIIGEPQTTQYCYSSFFDYFLKPINYLAGVSTTRIIFNKGEFLYYFSKPRSSI